MEGAVTGKLFNLTLRFTLHNRVTVSKGTVGDEATTIFESVGAKININYEVTFGDVLTSNVSPFIEFCH